MDMFDIDEQFEIANTAQGLAEELAINTLGAASFVKNKSINS